MSPFYTVNEAGLDDIPVLTKLRWMMCEEQGAQWELPVLARQG